MKVTITDVAKKANVSKSTVSRIMNGNFDQNTEETVNRVLKVIEELDYRPNALARSLKLTKTNVIGIVLSNLQNPFWASVLEGAEEACQSHGYNLMICNSNNNGEIEKEHLRSFEMKQIDGLMINPTSKNLDTYKKMIDNDFPFISINRKIYGLDAHVITVDNVKGAKMATTHLIRQGRRKIAIFLYQAEGISPRLERLQGYKLALIENGIDIDPSLILMVDEKKGEIAKAVQKVFSAETHPDAIFSTSSMMTLEILEGISQTRYSIPKDVALIGYDETVWSKHLYPPLSTIWQPAFEMGGLAAKKLIEMIETKKPKEVLPKVISLDPQLIKRESCGEAQRGGVGLE
ncbi:LacI family DNA-binding transcriptional regulator [Mesobacillus foraminis]|uniref:LacI family DNA-binding transcriptional regulator n=1 Tax=Mesobacillus foraminis TaxID=279826 RepID=UPI001BE87565|nr:LacI family DNA-binding transcriptional regulator [Mesobacillus foraminis]MBT2757775.1 LacI family DNA-binding transcriptional regulator [Mesobacillus foraminis]